MSTKIELIGKTVWTIKDIQEYFGFSKGTACKIKKMAIDKYDGLVKFGSQYVKTDSVFRIFSTSSKEEKSRISG